MTWNIKEYSEEDRVWHDWATRLVKEKWGDNLDLMGYAKLVGDVKQRLSLHLRGVSATEIDNEVEVFRIGYLNG